MIRFGIDFDSPDELKAFLFELSKIYSLDNYEVSSGRILSFELECKRFFDVYLLVGEIHTIILNLHMKDSTDVFSVDFCNLIE